MKKIRNMVIMIGLSTALLVTPVLAMTRSVSGYRCKNSSCGAYLEKKYQLAQCTHCGANLYAYKCNSCGSWYAICENGHFDTVVGR